MSDDVLKRAVGDWTAAPGVARILDVLDGGGVSARFVGGCVRNALLSAPVADLDLAVDAPPETVSDLLERGDVKTFPTGVEHGTITALAREDGAEPVEVTTLRRDVETDGRRAVVAFTRDWAEDAMRRDFTMNALYADRDGRLFDPLGGGRSDLDARRVRFIGRAEDRIREDRLRILRFFRFLAWYGDVEQVDAADLADCAAHALTIAELARERVWRELKKLFEADDPSAAVGLMDDAGALQASLGLASPAPAARLRRLVDVERAVGAAPSWRRRVAALSAVEPTLFARALKLSRTEAKSLGGLAAARGTPPLEAAYRYGATAAWDAALLEAAAHELEPPAADRLAGLEAAEAARPPVSATDFLAAGLPPGPAIGAALAAAERYWIEHNFNLDRDTLLAHGLRAGQQS